MKYIFDETDFCRECKGKGSVDEYDYSRGVTISERCWDCGGTGRRAIVVKSKEETK